MVDIEQYISTLTDSLKQAFASRLLYVGLQGSYLRGEATDGSDLDIMVIIDNLSVPDLDRYRTIISSIDHYELSCGFICSRTDLANWNPLEICNLLHGTKDYYGTLSNFVPPYTAEDIRNFVKYSLNILYHEICHRYIHSGRDISVASLPGSYKCVFFILQNLYFLKQEEFIATKAELLTLLDGKDHAVLLRAMELDNGIGHEFSESFALLFTWCQETMNSL